MSHIIMGHFHHSVHRELGDGRRFDVIPAWKYRYEVGVLAADGSLEVHPWMEVKMKNEQRG